TFKKDASLDRYRAQIQGLVDDLSKLNNSQPHVRLNTKGAYNDLKLLQNYLDDYERRKPHAEVALTGDDQVKRERQALKMHAARRKPHAEVALTGDDQVKRELQALKMHAERILRDVDFEVDVDDDRAKLALEQFRAQAEAMRDINVGVDVDLNRAEYERVRAQ